MSKSRDADKLQALENEAASAAYLHLRRRSMLFLEAAVSALLDTEPPEHVAVILRQMADQVEADK